MNRGIAFDRIIGEAAALENLIAHCESDIGRYRRDDRTERQNHEMWEALDKLKTELTARRATLLAKL